MSGDVPVVLLHALGLDARMWGPVRSTLRARGHRVWAPNQRGYGSTPLGTEAPSLDVVADDLARALDARDVDRAVLAGASMGGYAASAFLRRHPDRVAGLALVASRADADDPATATGRRAFATAVLDPAVRLAALAAVLPGLVGATTRTRRPRIVARVEALIQAAAPETVAWCQHAIADRSDAVRLLAGADVPAVVVAGAEDGLVPVDEARRTAALLPKGELVVVPEAGHLLPLEAPAATTDALHGLLTRIRTEVPTC